MLPLHIADAGTEPHSSNKANPAPEGLPSLIGPIGDTRGEEMAPVTTAALAPCPGRLRHATGPGTVTASHVEPPARPPAPLMPAAAARMGVSRRAALPAAVQRPMLAGRSARQQGLVVRCAAPAGAGGGCGCSADVSALLDRRSPFPGACLAAGRALQGLAGTAATSGTPLPGQSSAPADRLPTKRARPPPARPHAGPSAAAAAASGRASSWAAPSWGRWGSFLRRRCGRPALRARCALCTSGFLCELRCLVCAAH